MEIISRTLFNIAAVISKGDVPGVPTQDLDSSATQTMVKIVFGFAGGIALIMVVIGGFKYISSLGNAQNVAKAKDTILYAIIGLVVCVLGYAIISFVVTKVTT